MDGPEELERRRTLATAAAKRAATEDVFRYTTGDEPRGPGLDGCFCAASVAALRTWLRARYGTIERLNAAWGTSWARFDEVEAMTLDEVRVHARAHGSYAPWLDARRRDAEAYAALSRGIVDAVAGADPGVPVGPSGTQEERAGNATDWSLLSHVYTGLSAYGGFQTLEQDTFAPELDRSTWIGYGKVGAALRAAAIADLAEHDRGIGVFAARQHVNPDLTLPEGGKDLRGTLLELRRGLGPLLAAATPIPDPILVYASAPSITAAHALGRAEPAIAARTGVLGLLRDLGLRARALSDAELAGGQRLATARVLLLPWAVSLSDAQLTALRTWVERGGTLITDDSSGLMDEHGRVLDPTRLPRALGVDRARARQEAVSPAPAMQSVTVGRGRVVLVDDSTFGTYAADRAATPDERRHDALTATAATFERLFAEAGVLPRAVVRVRDPRRSPELRRAPRLWTARERLGDVELVLLFSDGAGVDALERWTATLSLRPAGGVVYDVVAGALLGVGDQLDLTVEAGALRVLAVLPEVRRAVEVEAMGGAVVERGRVVKLRLATRGGGAGALLHLEVLTPDGRARREYGADLIVAGAAVEHQLPLAANDPTGRWALVATDVTTGVERTLELQVK